MIKIDPVLLQREFLFVLAAALSAMLLFLMRTGEASRIRTRPIGRRATDLEKSKSKTQATKLSKKVSELTEDLWVPSETGAFVTLAAECYDTWRITLFDVRKRHRSRSEKNDFGFFEFGETAQDADLELAPLVRKIVSKYREFFHDHSTLEVLRESHTQPLYTWLANESDMRTVVFNFLDECVSITKRGGYEARLCIHWNDIFVIKVTWNSLNHLHVIQRLLRDTPELSLEASDQFGTSLSLWIAFTEKNIPSRLRVKYGISTPLPAKSVGA